MLLNHGLKTSTFKNMQDRECSSNRRALASYAGGTGMDTPLLQLCYQTSHALEHNDHGHIGSILYAYWSIMTMDILDPPFIFMNITTSSIVLSWCVASPIASRVVELGLKTSTLKSMQDRGCRSNGRALVSYLRGTGTHTPLSQSCYLRLFHVDWRN